MVVYRCDRCKKYANIGMPNLLQLNAKKYDLCGDCFNTFLGIINKCLDDYIQEKPSEKAVASDFT